MFNRDMNSAQNIKEIVKKAINKLERPEYLVRIQTI